MRPLLHFMRVSGIFEMQTICFETLGKYTATSPTTLRSVVDFPKQATFGSCEMHLPPALRELWMN